MPRTTHERRHEPRVQAFNLVHAAEYTFSGIKTEESIGRTLDLSNDGMRLELDHSLPLRSTVQLRLALGNQILELKGRIRFISEVDETTSEMGIEFVDVPAPERQALDEYLQLRSS